MKTPAIIALITGLKDVLNPKVEDVQVWDWAWGLHFTPRWSGATPVMWDVLSHTGLMFLLAMQDTKGTLNPYDRFGILVHDSTEALGFSDLPSPIKETPEFAFYKECEHAMMLTIFQRFGVEWDAVDWDLVKRYDRQALYVEWKTFFDYAPGSPHEIKPVYEMDMKRIGKLAVAQPKDYVSLLREIAINLGTSDVNALFLMPEKLRPYVEPNEKEGYGEIVDGDILKAKVI